MSDIVIVAAKRTPIGKFMGSLSGFSSHELGKFCVDAVIDQSGVKKEQINEVILGQVLSGGSGQNPARQTAILSEIPVEKSALTINQVCG